jgi:hypothetical protein
MVTTMPGNLIEHGNKKVAPDVPERVKAAAEILSVTPGPIDYQKLAEQVGYTNARGLRRALSLPQSIRYLREHKRQVLETINLHNPEALRRVRDDQQSNKMASVAAVRQLEVMQKGDEFANVNRTPHQVAGFTILIRHEIEAPGATRITGHLGPMIDATADAIDDAELVYGRE